MIVTLELLSEDAKCLLHLIRMSVICDGLVGDYWKRMADHIEQSIESEFIDLKELEHAGTVQTTDQ